MINYNVIMTTNEISIFNNNVYLQIISAYMLLRQIRMQGQF